MVAADASSQSTGQSTGDRTSPKPQTASAGPSLLRAAGLIAVVTIASKVLGAIRDWQIMNVYGASLPSDAYFAAVQLPSFAIVLLGGLGGPFHTATVAIFSKLLKDTDGATDQARRLASTFITLTGAGFLGLSILTYLFAQPVMALILQEAPPALIENATQQLQIMSPVLFFGGLIGIFYGLLNVYHSFFWPSLSPAALSLVMSVALLVNPNDSTGHLLAWSTLAGTVAQFAMQLPEFFKRRFSLGLAWDWRAPEIRQIGEMLFPAIVGTTIGQLTTYVDMFFAQYLVVGGWTAIVMGNRLFQLPIGVLQTAFLVPIFPRFSRYVAEQNWAELRRTFRMGVVSLWLISLPVLIGILLYIEPLVRLVFQHGAFDADDTRMVSEALIWLSWSMMPYFARDSITRVFYAFEDSRTPLMVGMAAIVIKGVLDWLLVVQSDFGVGGITFSTTLVTIFNMTLLGLLSRRHIADLGFGEMVIPFVKLTAAGGLMALGVWAVDPLLGAWLAQGLDPVIGATGSELVKIAILGVFGTLAYLGLVIGLRVEEMQLIVSRLRRR
jgi:putative peptidoglycan lipid II flippase